MIAIFSNFSLFACTNFIITKGASKDGSCMVSYAADSHTLYGELYYRPAADYPAGAMMDVIEWDTAKDWDRFRRSPIPIRWWEI